MKFWRWLTYGKVRPRPFPDAPLGAQTTQTVPLCLLSEAQSGWAVQGWDVHAITTSSHARFGLRVSIEDATAVLAKIRASQ
jgi:hypothetical protein